MDWRGPKTIGDGFCFKGHPSRLFVENLVLRSINESGRGEEMV